MLHQAQNWHASETTPDKSPATYAGGGGIIHVLLVDDDATQLTLLRKMLALAAGVRFQINTARTLEEGLDRIRAGGIDVAVLDLSLPDSSGYETFSRMRSAAPNLPVIVLSGLDDELLALRMVQEGAQDYLIKADSDIRMLARAIRYAIERKNVERALADERNLLRNVLNTLPDSIYVKDIEGRYIVDNVAHTRFLGVEREEDVIGRNAFDFFPPEEAAKLDAEDRQVMQSLEPVLDRLEAGSAREDGRECWLSATKVPLLNGHGDVVGVVGVRRDITDLKETEARLRNSRRQMRALVARLETIREEDRTRIARELHDQIGQLLTALRIEILGVATHPPDRPEELVEKARCMSEIVNSTIQSVREICAELRPAMLDDLGLCVAIAWHAKEFEKRTGITCKLASPEEVELDSARSTAVFRIVQEALTNVVRHAQATRVQIAMERKDGVFELEVVDNGRGIDCQEISRGTSLGLLGIRERVQVFGGQAEISGAPGQGTSVRVRIPCTPTPR